MASSESASIGSTPPAGVGSERADSTGDLLAPTDVPPSTRTTRGTRRRRKRGRAEVADDTRAPAGSEEPLFAPAHRPGRRVVRIVRHVQLWSVFKVTLLGGLVLYVVFLIATALGWSLLNATGQVHSIEQFMRQIGFENWSFDGPRLFQGAALAGAVLLTAGSVLITLWAAIVNLISEATGGIRFTVIETDETDEDDAADAEDGDPRRTTADRDRAGRGEPATRGRDRD